ncbi:Cysteine-rich protein [Spironucleus salmonicida]|uniref:Cysteine-rich protein n=1 Tax=Spironucleus salmonicida TaxID=348837 RepID=V6LQ50_9EUKA|nr:Cysteine-rich protein [Spironucleus salmonicida]|eukprot:EST46705.1 Cysteine-rich protein [Spironucleus salmonicida]
MNTPQDPGQGLPHRRIKRGSRNPEGAGVSFYLRAHIDCRCLVLQFYPCHRCAGCCTATFLGLGLCCVAHYGPQDRQVRRKPHWTAMLFSALHYNCLTVCQMCYCW